MKLFGKIGRTLVSDLAYVIVHHLKSIRRTYFGIKGISIPLIYFGPESTNYLFNSYETDTSDCLFLKENMTRSA